MKCGELGRAAMAPNSRMRHECVSVPKGHFLTQHLNLFPTFQFNKVKMLMFSDTADLTASAVGGKGGK